MFASLVGGASAIAAPPEADAGSSEQTDHAQRKALAKQHVQLANAAFSTGDYQAALEHYETAMATLPAPKLHYNIAVCHQRLSLKAETAEDRTRERDLAVESYNRYLEQNPQAEDRLEVAETIRELGGTPVTMPTLKPLFEGDTPPDEVDTGDPASDPGPDAPPEAPGVDTTPQAPTPRKPPYPSHGRFGILLAGGYSPTMRAAEAVDAPGMFAVEFYGGGFVGRRRRFLLAAQTMLFGGATLQADGFSFYGYTLGLLGQQTWVLGREAVQIGFGGLAAVTGQGLNQREDVPPPICRLDRGVQIAGRSGGVFAPRFDLGLLLGYRRRGMISLLVQPSFAVFGDGPSGTQCASDETPWTVLGIRRRWQFQLWAGAGFSFRF